MKATRIAILMLLLVTTGTMVVAQPTYPATWRDLTNVTVTAGNTLTKTGGVSGFWDAGAVSVNILPASANGYVEFTYVTIANYYMVSLSRVNKNPSYALSDYSFFVVGGSLQIYETQTLRGSFGTLANGDMLKISREGLTIKYYKNGVVIHTTNLTATSALYHLRADVSIHYVNTVVPAVTCSFDRVLSLKPTITFPTLANNDGAITITPEGGDAPYTYVWSSSETTAGISGKARGSFTVTVTDASGRTATATYYLGYPITWTNLEGANMNADGSLTRNLSPTTNWGAGASSLNRIAPNTDGFIEFAVPDATASFLIGLSDHDPDVSYATIDFAIAVDAFGAVLTYSSGSSVNWGSLRRGDVFRLGREGTQIKAYRNGVLLTTIGGGTSLNALYADVAVGGNEGPTPVITISADKQIRVKPTLGLPGVSNNDGSIALSAQGGYNPISISWTPGGETTNLITGKPRGAYGVTVTDVQFRTVTRNYRLGYPVVWTDLQNCQLNADNTVSQNAGGGWTAGATSTNVLPANTDGWIEFVVGRSRLTYMLGLSRLNSTTTYNNIDYAFYLLNGNLPYARELGAQAAIFSYVEEGDVLAIAREGSNIKYYINGAVVRTVTTVPSYQLVVDISLNGGALPSPYITTSFSRTPQTFYTIASGNWTTPAIWSLTEGGAPAALYPASGDLAVIKGSTVTVSSVVTAPNVDISVTNDNTALKVDGSQAVLNVKGSVNIQGLNNANTAKALQVMNDAKINVKNP